MEYLRAGEKYMADQVFHEQLFRTLYLIRRVEEEIARAYPTNKVQSPVHLSIGEESVSVGVCAALWPEDVVFGTYRSHALYLAKGGDLNLMMAELYGRLAGCARGKGGSMHLVAPEVGMMGTSAVVGTTIPQAVGYAYAQKLWLKDTVVASFFGDGATEEGAIHESLNFAGLKKLPILFVCENNFYSIHTPLHKRQPLDNIYERARVYGIPSTRVDDGDVLKVYHAAQRAIRRIRNGGGPFFLECRVYRWREHVGPNEDFQGGYRSQDEAAPWFDRDPVRVMGELLDIRARRRVEEEVETEIREAFAFAEQAPFPPAEELYANVFKEA
jgi:TPP-dependent pyruvate/acetoin dehydrogenase alpha subunit